MLTEHFYWGVFKHAHTKICMQKKKNPFILGLILKVVYALKIIMQKDRKSGLVRDQDIYIWTGF